MVIRFAAASRASFGAWRPLVMFSRAEAIADQNFPISGMLGIGSPSWRKSRTTNSAT